MDYFLFSVAAIIAVVSAVLVIVQRNPMHSALYLIITLLCIAVLYLQLSAQFVAAVQVIVYAGAIMVLFLFVLMLLDQENPIDTPSTLRYQNPVAAVMGLLLLVELLFLSARAQPPAVLTSGAPGSSPGFPGSVESVAESMFTRYLFPFELTSVLLLIGMVGVIVLAKRKL